MAQLGSFQVRVGQQGLKELLSLICNIEPNTGDERMDNPGPKLFNSVIVPKMERFHGLVEKGYTILQPFKTMTSSFTEKMKMHIFAGPLDGKRYPGI